MGGILMDLIIGTLIPGIVAVIVTHLLNLYKDWKKDQRFKVTLLNSLLSEVLAIQSLILVRKQEFILQDPKNILDYKFSYLPTTYDYFTVYESCAKGLGQIENKELQKLIISNYVDLKGLFENVRDLGMQAIEFNKIIIADSKKEYLPRFVEWHYAYSEMILNKQVPMIELQLNNLIKALQEEIKVQESRKWYCYLFS